MKQVWRRIRGIQSRRQHVDRVKDVLIDCEEYLGDLCLRINFQFLLYVVWFADQGYGARRVVFNNVWFGRDS